MCTSLLTLSQISLTGAEVARGPDDAVDGGGAGSQHGGVRLVSVPVEAVERELRAAGLDQVMMMLVTILAAD